MRALVVGAGSIGLRHGRILGSMGLEVAWVTSRDDVGGTRFTDLASALSAWVPEYVVVANPTVAHQQSILSLGELGYVGRTLVEKPLFANAVESAVCKPSERLKVGYNLRFHPAVAALKAGLADRGAACANLYCGSYLPGWRAGTDHRASYSASRGGGGGVLRDVSHELDLALWLFGPANRVVAHGGTFGDLGIETEDAVTVIMESERCPMVTVHLNYLEQIQSRLIRIVEPEGGMTLDLTSGTLLTGELTRTFDVERDETFVAEHRDVLGDLGVACTFEEGRAVVHLIEAIEESMQNGGWAEVQS